LGHRLSTHPPRARIRLVALFERDGRSFEWPRPRGWALRALHGIDLRGALGQRTLRPALAGVLAGEHLAATGGAVHSPGLPRVEGDGEDGGLRLHAHLHPRPGGPAVLAAEQNAEPALE